MTGSAATGKARFEDVYDQPDPRAYFARLGPLEYEIPHHAQPAFRAALQARRAAVGDDPAVLDLACSYGINAALLNHDLSLSELYGHYTGDRARRLTAGGLCAWDRDFYAERRRADAARVIGLDIAGNALRYALDVGLLARACPENLERWPPSAGLREAMAGVGLITLTGGGSYLTRRTFDALLAWARRPVWVSAFVLRTVSYAPIADSLAGHGLRTEADTARTYPQRLFTDAEERRYAVEAVRARGHDPAGREVAGRFHTIHYTSRPADGG